MNHSPEVLREKAAKASQSWCSELERRVKSEFLPPGQISLEGVRIKLYRACCCPRLFVVQLWWGDVCSVFGELLRRLKLWLFFVEPELISISEGHHMPAWAEYSTDRSEQDTLLEIQRNSGGIPSALTFQEGGRNTAEMKEIFLLIAPKA